MIDDEDISNLVDEVRYLCEKKGNKNTSTGSDETDERDLNINVTSGIYGTDRYELQGERGQRLSLDCQDTIRLEYADTLRREGSVDGALGDIITDMAHNHGFSYLASDWGDFVIAKSYHSMNEGIETSLQFISTISRFLDTYHGCYNSDTSE